MDRVFAFDTYTNQRRNAWKFEYTASDLAKAAAAQRDYRLGRVKVWEKEKDKVLKRAASAGLSIQESLVEKMSAQGYTVAASVNNNFNPTRRARARIVVDETLQQNLDEALAKIDEHRKLASEYDAWVQMLNANKESRVELSHADWMFFFGK